MQIVGILGGFGPLATAKFYLKLNNLCAAQTGHRPAMLIWNTPLDLSTEREFILRGRGADKYLAHLIAGAKLLQAAGAEFLVIPCNTLHIFVDKIREEINIPIISIIEETKKLIKSHGINNVGLLATSVSRSSNLFGNIFVENNVNIIKPNSKDQHKTDQIIVRLVNGETMKEDEQALLHIMDKLHHKGAEVIILACTDLQNIISANGKTIFDTLEILAESVSKIIVDNFH